jgi:hypothetical protein
MHHHRRRLLLLLLLHRRPKRTPNPNPLRPRWDIPYTYVESSI